MFRICSAPRPLLLRSEDRQGVGQLSEKKPNAQVIKNQYRHRDALLLVSELYIYPPNNSDFNSKRKRLFFFENFEIRKHFAHTTHLRLSFNQPSCGDFNSDAIGKSRRRTRLNSGDHSDVN